MKAYLQLVTLFLSGRFWLAVMIATALFNATLSGRAFFERPIGESPTLVQNAVLWERDGGKRADYQNYQEVSRRPLAKRVFKKPKPYVGLFLLFVAACSALRGLWNIGYMQHFIFGSLWVLFSVALLDCGLGLMFFGDLGQLIFFLFGDE
jgi:hypothetical protein